ncbi:DUF2523 family protein [Colwellia sp. RE-S-Sl-9]
MRLIIVVCCLFSFSVLAQEVTSGSVDGLSGFFTFVSNILADINNFIFVTIPELINNFFVWVTSFYLKLQFFAMYESLKFSHEVALTFLSMIDISSFINSAISALPQDMKQLAVDLRFFEALTLVVEAWVTRLVYTGFN